MIKKLRIKFIVINMLIVTVVLSILLSFIIFSTRLNLENDSINMMRNIAVEPWHQGPIREPDNTDMRLPFMVISHGRDGSLSAKGGYYDLSDTDTIQYLYDTACSSPDDVGVIEQYDLRFVRTKAPGSNTVVVLSDISSEKIVLKGIVKDCLLIGAAALGGFFIISILLARWAVKPVEKAWNRQKQFIADASHDLKTPLTVILTDSELLQQENCSKENRLKLADAISTMAIQMKGLVSSMLNLASVENDSRVVPSEVNFSEVVNNVCLTFEPSFYENGLGLESEVADGVIIKGNESELSNLVSILLDNAEKYCSKNTSTSVVLKSQGKGCLLTVSDCGDEIPKEDMENIFKRFYRADKARSMNQSYGLGLSIASQIVNNHKGKIWCESKNGINSFFVKL